MNTTNSALNMAVGSAVTNSTLTSGGGVGGGGNSSARGAFGIGLPVYTSPSGNFSLGLGAASNYGRNSSSNFAMGAGMKFRF